MCCQCHEVVLILIVCEVEQSSSATWACLLLSRRLWLLGSLLDVLLSLLGDLDLLEDRLAVSLGGDGDPLLPDVDENGGGLYFSSVEALGQVRELCPKPLQFQHVIWVDGIRSFLTWASLEGSSCHLLILF